MQSDAAEPTRTVNLETSASAPPSTSSGALTPPSTIAVQYYPTDRRTPSGVPWSSSPIPTLDDIAPTCPAFPVTRTNHADSSPESDPSIAPAASGPSHPRTASRPDSESGAVAEGDGGTNTRVEADSRYS